MSGSTEKFGGEEKASDYVQAPPVIAQSAATRVNNAESVITKAKSADEGEFMHLKAQNVEGLELLGKIAMFLRRRGTVRAARAYELLRRGAVVKERDDAIAFVVEDDNFLQFTDSEVLEELNAALDSCGIKKRARAEKTDDDLYADDLTAARELFGFDAVVPRERI